MKTFSSAVRALWPSVLSLTAIHRAFLMRGLTEEVSKVVGMSVDIVGLEDVVNRRLRLVDAYVGTRGW